MARGLDIDAIWLWNDRGNHITPTREQNNSLQTAKMYSNKVLFACIQIKSLLKVKPI